MPVKIQLNSRFAQKLYEALIPELKRGVLAVDRWAVLGTLAGSVRLENQDRLFAGQFTSRDRQTIRVVALSDGMGGLDYGQEAAALTLSSFLAFLVSSAETLPVRLSKAAKHANEIVRSQFRGEAGATLSAVLQTETGEVIAVNVGDSRIYGYNKNTRLLRQLSTDDTLAGLADQGAAVDARHNSGALLQHIGMGADLEPNILDGIFIENVDFLLLTTDGIHWVGNKLLELISQNASDNGQLTRRLLQLAEMSGAHDNATVGTISLGIPFDNTDTERNDTEVWTPQAKAIFILEKYASAYGDIELGIRQVNQPYEPRVAPKSRPRNKAPRKKSTRKSINNNQQEFLPIEKPDIIIDFDKPKRKENETSG